MKKDRNWYISRGLDGPIAERTHPLFLNLLKKVFPKSTLLDIGCGKGFLSTKAFNMGFKVHACDIHPKNEYKNKFWYKSIKWKKVDLNKGKLPYRTDFFNCVLCIEVLEHLENPRAILKEISRVIKKDGVFIVSTPHLESLPQRIYFLLTGKFLHFFDHPKKYEHITPIGMQLINDEFIKLGFKIEKITYDRGWIPLLRITLPRCFLFGDLRIIQARKI